MTELHEMDPERRFSDRAADYARCRPDYSDDAVRSILDGFSRPTVADVGAGTGISSRRLASNGARVVAIEPNESMVAAAIPHEGVRYVVASAEASTLADGSVDIVTCFQAFHWFRAAEALSEFARIVRSGGRLALVWNERDESDAFTREYGAIIRETANDHPAERRLEASRAIYETSLFGSVRHLRFPFEQRFDGDGLLGRARSASYLPSEGAAYDVMRDALMRLHTKWRDGEGLVTLRYVTEVFTADVVK